MTKNKTLYLPHQLKKIFKKSKIKKLKCQNFGEILAKRAKEKKLTMFILIEVAINIMEE